MSKQAWLASIPLNQLSQVQINTSPLRVASFWYHFSVFAADFLCLALPLLQSHTNRSYVAQTVDEELGHGEPSQVHSVLLLEALEQAGIDKQELIAYPTTELDDILNSLRNKLLNSKNDYEVAGFFLGFELLAEHNISHVFECLQPYNCAREELLETPYFQEHFKVEPEHIRRALTMGLNCCSDEHQIKAMIHNYHHGIVFWNRFWNVVHQDILEANQQLGSQQDYALKLPSLLTVS
ncbi:iron-containing redox enzyme family protein [[Leptolyngbya] sp. PCC 7376]|uniref:iron-containing redox enzyme family protein n=1 Tax=[Leptolyngbya] sp. PCC 7376 TaxID=111781 RepID=UPI001C1E4A32|nr:iron-containing redox enzyme family protein [[Leptolyngbya] sp. PCC 7376]